MDQEFQDFIEPVRFLSLESPASGYHETLFEPDTGAQPIESDGETSTDEYVT